jgi:hypothetical protein
MKSSSSIWRYVVNVTLIFSEDFFNFCSLLRKYELYFTSSDLQYKTLNEIYSEWIKSMNKKPMLSAKIFYHQKPTSSLIFGTLSLWDCGGHSMRLKLNFNDKGQSSKSNEYTDNFRLNLTCIFLSVRTKLKKKKTLCPRTLCSI